jgi:hypothetical protein
VEGDSDRTFVSTKEMPKKPKKYAKQQLHRTIIGKNIFVNGLGLSVGCVKELR